MLDMPTTGPDALPMDERFVTNPEAYALWHQYRLAIEFVDGEFGRIMDSLKMQQLLDETIVIVASDHGYEFDDNGLGYIGHASNFSPAQLHATLMMHWPGKPPTDIAYRTSHHDLPATLLQDVFDCRNPVRDYSMGRNLFSGKPWTWMIAGSYTDHAIVEPDQVIVSHPGGFVEIRGRDYRPVSDSSLNTALIQESMEVQRRFFR
jgi:membrane-anchored protein YejM (alkaline phosphatase superfamily)